MIMPNDRMLLNAAAILIGATPLYKAGVIHADSTLNLERLLVSEALLPQIKDMDRVEVTGPVKPPVFDAYDNLISVELL
jgi:hypothetical protein